VVMGLAGLVVGSIRVAAILHADSVEEDGW
jgi:hypothetical protein